MRSPLLILLATSALAFTAACGTSEEEVPGRAASPTAALTPSPISVSPAATAIPAITPGPGVTLWRWVNVTVVIPDSSDVHLKRTYYASDVNRPDGGPVLQFAREVSGDPDGASWLLIDGESGRVIRDDVRDEHRAEYDAILRTLTVGQLDRAIAPWPYNKGPPAELTREKAGDISFLRPSPETGLDVYTSVGFPGGSVAVGIANGRSTLGLYVDSETGALSQNHEQLLAADRDVFERWAATVKLCGGDLPC
jgi:hypothetical protein